MSSVTIALRTASSSGTLPATTVTARTSIDRIAHREHERDRVVGRGVGVDDDAATGHGAKSAPAISRRMPPATDSVALGAGIATTSGRETVVQSRRSMMVALAMPPPSHITCRP